MSTPVTGQRPSLPTANTDPTKKTRLLAGDRLVASVDGKRSSSCSTALPSGTQIKGRRLFTEKSTRQPCIVLDSDSDTELPQSETTSPVVSPSRSPSETPMTSLSPSPARSPATSEGRSKHHDAQPVVENTDLIQEKISTSPSGSDKVHSAKHGNTEADQGSHLTDNPKKLDFMKFKQKDRELQSLVAQVFKLMSGLVKKSTSKQDPNQNDDLGCIYVFQDPYNEDYVKIGRTAWDPEERKQQLARCGLDHLIVVGYVQAPNHKTLETLIHRILENERYKYHCVCKRQHREWFKLDKDVALRTVSLWGNWMTKRPYDENRALKIYWKDKIARCRKDMKQFMQTLESETAEGRAWENFLTMEVVTSTSIAWHWIFHKRQDSDGKYLSSRFDSMLEHWKGRTLSFVALFGLFYKVATYEHYQRSAILSILFVVLTHSI